MHYLNALTLLLLYPLIVGYLYIFVGKYIHFSSFDICRSEDCKEFSLNQINSDDSVMMSQLAHATANVGIMN